MNIYRKSKHGHTYTHCHECGKPVYLLHSSQAMDNQGNIYHTSCYNKVRSHP